LPLVERKISKLLDKETRLFEEQSRAKTEFLVDALARLKLISNL